MESPDSRQSLLTPNPSVETASARKPQALITSTKELTTFCTHSSNDERHEFRFCSFAFVAKDHTVYYGQSTIQRVTTAIANENLKQIPDEDVYPVAPPQITRATITDDNSIFIKRPSFPGLDVLQGTGLLAVMLLQEAEVLELLRERPHPNIVQYYGCEVSRGRIVGLALQRHPHTLQECLNYGNELDLVSGPQDIKAALAHLHSLGLAHNDIRLCNIMVSAEGRWILIDMGSCKPFGQDLITSGDPDWTTSSKEHDDIALNNILIDLRR